MKALIQVVPRCGGGSEAAFDQRFTERCAALRETSAAGVRVNAMRRIDRDKAPIGPDTPYRAALELPEAVAEEGLAHLGRTPAWAAGPGNRANFPLRQPRRACTSNAMRRIDGDKCRDRPRHALPGRTGTAPRRWRRRAWRTWAGHRCGRPARATAPTSPS